MVEKVPNLLPEKGEDARKAVEKVEAVYVLRGVAGVEAAVSERQYLIYYLTVPNLCTC